MPSLTKTKALQVPASSQRRARAQVAQVFYWPRSDLSGIVADIGQNAPFEGEIVRHTAERRENGRQPKKGLYDLTTYAEGLYRSNTHRVSEEQALADAQKFLTRCIEQLGWYNFISLDRYIDLLTNPAQLAEKLAGARDPAKLKASSSLAEAGRTHDRLGRTNVSRNMAHLVGAADQLEDRHQYLESSVMPANVALTYWAETLIQTHSQIAYRICRQLYASDGLAAVWHQISADLARLQVKPWTFIKHYIGFIGRRETIDNLSPNINLQLINAFVLEGAQTDLRETARLAETAAGPAASGLVLHRLQSRIDWLASLDLPPGYSGSSTQPGLQQRLLVSLERLKHRVRNADSTSARKQEGNQLRWDLRYRALPDDTDCAMWHGPVY